MTRRCKDCRHWEHKPIHDMISDAWKGQTVKRGECHCKDSIFVLAREDNTCRHWSERKEESK